MTKLLVPRDAQASQALIVPSVGIVTQFEDTVSSVTVTSSGKTKQVATMATANIDFFGGLVEKLPRKRKRTSTVTISGSDCFYKEKNVVDDTDLNSGINNSVTVTEA